MCQCEEKECYETLIGDERPALVFCDYSQTWEKYKSNTCTENGFLKDVYGESPPIDVQNPVCKTFIRIFPEAAIDFIFGLEKPSIDFITKWNRFLRLNLYKIRNQCNPTFKKNTVAKDWNLLNDFLEIAVAACGHYSREPKPAVVIIKNTHELRKAVYEGILMTNYVDDTDKWDIVSRAKFHGIGWADLAKAELESEKKKLGRGAHMEITPFLVNQRADAIRRKVEALRNGVSPDTDAEDEDGWESI